jgi:drug/metabolite transporter (DMT)-like permease
MSSIAILLVSVSSVIHALWNLAGKRQNPSAAFFLISASCAALVTLPLLWIYRLVLGEIPALVWLFLAATGVFQAAYYIGLAGAYQGGEISVAYPLVRSLPVLLIALTSLALGKSFSLLGSVGILAVAGGCLLIPLPDLRTFHWRYYLSSSLGLVLLAVLGTTGYTLIDNQALSILRSLPGRGLGNTGSAMLFLALENLVTALILGGYVGLTAGERRLLRSTKPQRMFAAAGTGVLITITYGMVLLAMAFTTNVSYIAAFRQLSIPLAAVLGFLVQKEHASAPRLLGIGTVVVGLTLIALAS